MKYSTSDVNWREEGSKNAYFELQLTWNKPKPSGQIFVLHFCQIETNKIYHAILH